MEPRAQDAPRRTPSLPWPFLPGFLPLWYGWLGWSWWREIRIQLQAVPAAGPAMDPGVGAAVALAARVLGALSEAGLYALWWKSRGAYLPYWRFVCWVASLSSADLLAFALHRTTREAGDVLRLIGAVLAGPAALDPAPLPASGAMAAFGGLGVLTLLRVGMTGWAQARGTGRSLAGPFVLAATAWLLTRLAAGWSFDLLKGLSPAP